MDLTTFRELEMLATYVYNVAGEPSDPQYKLVFK